VAAFVVLFAWPALVAALALPPSETGRYVYDLAHVWNAATIEQAQLEIADIRARTGTEIAVVSWPSGLSRVGLDTGRADALTIMDTWGVGRKGIDDGLVILFDLDTTLQHGQIYLYGGRGFLASYLSQADLQAVVNDAMLPPAKNGDLDGALLAGLALVDKAVVPGGNPHRGRQDAANLAEVELLVAATAVALGLFALTWWRRGRDARIPLIDDSVLPPFAAAGADPGPCYRAGQRRGRRPGLHGGARRPRPSRAADLPPGRRPCEAPAGRSRRAADAAG